MTEPLDAHAVIQEFRKLYRKRGIDVQRLLTQYGIERFPARLAASQHANLSVLKGAQLLRIRINEDFRPAKDVDLLGRGSSDIQEMAAIMHEIASIDLTDGLRFEPQKIRAEPIRDQAEYGGVRIKLLAYLDKTRVHVQVDIGFGDATSPPPELVTVPSLLF